MSVEGWATVIAAFFGSGATIGSVFFFFGGMKSDVRSHTEKLDWIIKSMNNHYNDDNRRFESVEDKFGEVFGRVNDQAERISRMEGSQKQKPPRFGSGGYAHGE